MRAIHVFVWRDGRREEVVVLRGAREGHRMLHDVRHKGASFQLQDWRVRYGADGTRETVLFYAERT